MTSGPGRVRGQPRRRPRRSFVFAFLMLDALVFAVGLAGAHDLRVLATPSGAAADFLRAASAGDCNRMTQLAPASSPVRDGLGDSAFCQREHSRYDGVAVNDAVVQTPGAAPTVSLRITTPAGRSSPLFVGLTGRTNHWTVVSITAFD